MVSQELGEDKNPKCARRHYHVSQLRDTSYTYKLKVVRDDRKGVKISIDQCTPAPVKPSSMMEESKGGGSIGMGGGHGASGNLGKHPNFNVEEVKFSQDETTIVEKYLRGGRKVEEKIRR